MFDLLDLTGLYKPRALLTMEGVCFAAGGVQVRLGRLSGGARALGFLLELEAPPDADTALDALVVAVSEAVASLAGSFRALNAPFADFGLPAVPDSGRHRAVAFTLAAQTLRSMDTMA